MDYTVYQLLWLFLFYSFLGWLAETVLAALKRRRSSIFSGLVYCADCGEKLYYGATNNYRPEGAFFDCSLH